MDSDRFFRAADNPYAPPAADEQAPAPDSPARALPADANPWRTIWTRPRETVRRLVDTDPTHGVILLTCLGGVAEALDRSSMKSAGDTLPLAAILGMACVLGPGGALLGLWISSAVTRLAGSWMGGSADSREIRTAIAWATVPSVCTSTMWVPQLALFGSEMFTTDTPRMDANPGLAMVLLATAAVETVGGIWAFVLACHTLAEVQGFRSAWAGLGNILLACLVVIVPIALVVAVLLAGIPLLFR